MGTCCVLQQEIKSAADRKYFILLCYNYVMCIHMQNLLPTLIILWKIQDVIFRRGTDLVAPHLVLVLVLFLLGRPIQSRSLRYFKSDQDDILQIVLQNCSSVDLVGFPVWRHTFKMTAMTSFHLEKCCQLVSGHATSAQRLCVCQFLIYRTLILVIASFCWSRTFYWSDTLPLAQATVSKHWKNEYGFLLVINSAVTLFLIMRQPKGQKFALSPLQLMLGGTPYKLWMTLIRKYSVVGLWAVLNFALLYVFCQQNSSVW